MTNDVSHLFVKKAQGAIKNNQQHLLCNSQYLWEKLFTFFTCKLKMPPDQILAALNYYCDVALIFHIRMTSKISLAQQLK